MYFESSTANFDKKMSTKSVYLLGTLEGASSIFRWAIGAFFKGCLSSPESTLRAATYTMKILCSESKSNIENFSCPTSLTYLVVKNKSQIV